jgi:amidase
LEHNPHSLHSVTDLIDFIKRTPEEEYENWGVSTFEKAEAATLTDNEIQELVEIRQDMGFDIQRLLTNYQCDIIAIPAACRNPSDLGQCPTITIPMGFYPENTKIEAGKNGVTKAPNIPWAHLENFNLLLANHHLESDCYLLAQNSQRKNYWDLHMLSSRVCNQS